MGGLREFPRPELIATQDLVIVRPALACNASCSKQVKRAGINFLLQHPLVAGGTGLLREQRVLELSTLDDEQANDDAALYQRAYKDAGEEMQHLYDEGDRMNTGIDYEAMKHFRKNYNECRGVVLRWAIRVKAAEWYAFINKYSDLAGPWINDLWIGPDTDPMRKINAKRKNEEEVRNASSPRTGPVQGDEPSSSQGPDGDCR